VCRNRDSIFDDENAASHPGHLSVSQTISQATCSIIRARETNLRVRK
jgi:hypothetical protein